MRCRLRTAVTAGIIAIGIAVPLTVTTLVSSANAAPSAPAASTNSKKLQTVLGLDQKYANMVVAGDTKGVSAILDPTFEMTHGNAWVDGGQPALVQNKSQFLTNVGKKFYTCIKFDDIQAELHGNIAITYGRYIASEAGQTANNAFFVVWYERVFQHEGNKWIYLSHRTVDGPHFGPTVFAALDGMGPADPDLTCTAGPPSGPGGTVNVPNTTYAI